MKLTNEMCNEAFADLPLDLKRWLVAVFWELATAQDKHPAWPADFIHAAAIVAEESGELVQAALQHQYENGQYYQMHREAIQTAAACLRFLLGAPEIPFNPAAEESTATQSSAGNSAAPGTI